MLSVHLYLYVNVSSLTQTVRGWHRFNRRWQFVVWKPKRNQELRLHLKNVKNHEQSNIFEK